MTAVQGSSARPDRPDDADGLGTPARYWAIVSVGLAIAMTVLDSSIANVALPTIARDFGAQPSESIWIINAYQLAIVISLLPLASLGEIVGFRRIYQGGLAVFTLASLACAISHTLPTLTAARALQGFGAAGVMSVNGGLVRFIYPTRMLGRGIGINAMIVSGAAAVGPSIASAILAVGPWPWLFAVNIPVGLAALALAARVLPANPLSGRRFDWVSASLNALTFGLVISGVDIATRTSARILGAAQILAGLVAGALLAHREWPRRRPLVPFDLLRGPIFALSVATSVASFAAQMLAFVSLPFHFEYGLHHTQVETGLLLTPWPVALAVAAPAAGWLADRVSTAVLCAIGLAAFAAGLFALMVLPASASSLDIAWRMALCGAGFGLFQSPNNRMMLTSAPRDRAGAAGGMLGTARLTGQIIGAVLTAVALHLFGGSGEVVALGTAAVFALAAASVSLLRLGRAPTLPLAA
ncbi:MAG TPA: MFS transporter [Caulobacteraceae bacterium]|nr:MFS transporter [Caulobacteraceae bacterium]